MWDRYSKRWDEAKPGSEPKIPLKRPVFYAVHHEKELDEEYVRTYYILMSKPSHREAILKAGLKVMFRSGYQGASVRDICAAAGVPQGSFTNHFRSKEAFAQEVLDRYFANLQGYVREALDDKSLTPRQRLKRYLDIISGVLEDAKWNRGCLIGDFSLETTSQSKLLRERLEGIFQEWCAPFASTSPRLKPPVKSIQRSIQWISPNSSWLPGRAQFSV